MQHSAAGLWALVLAAGVCGPAFGYVINMDSNYSRWPNKLVPVYISQTDNYSPSELGVIRGAINQMNTDMPSCVRFVERPNAVFNGQSYVIINRSGGPPGTAPSPTCKTFPGMVYNQNGAGQYLAMIGGTDGCLTTVAQAMRMFAALIGLRAEYRKPSRDLFITVGAASPAATATASESLATYPPSTVLANGNDFDYNSITNLDLTTYAVGASPVLKANGGQTIANPGRLSMKDCQGISFLYSCSASLCQDPFQAGGIPPVSQPAPVIAPPLPPPGAVF